MRSKLDPDDLAFPTRDYLYKGLTKREYFAGQIMQGFLASLASGAHADHFQPSIGAEVVVMWTDALIKALNK